MPSSSRLLAALLTAAALPAVSNQAGAEPQQSVMQSNAGTQNTNLAAPVVRQGVVLNFATGVLPVEGLAGSPGVAPDGNNNAQAPNGGNNARNPDGNNNARNPVGNNDAQNPNGNNAAAAPVNTISAGPPISR